MVTTGNKGKARESVKGLKKSENLSIKGTYLNGLWGLATDQEILEEILSTYELPGGVTRWYLKRIYLVNSPLLLKIDEIAKSINELGKKTGKHKDVAYVATTKIANKVNAVLDFYYDGDQKKGVGNGLGEAEIEKE